MFSPTFSKKGWEFPSQTWPAIPSAFMVAGISLWVVDFSLSSGLTSSNKHVLLHPQLSLSFCLCCYPALQSSTFGWLKPRINTLWHSICGFKMSSIGSFHLLDSCYSSWSVSVIMMHASHFGLLHEHLPDKPLLELCLEVAWSTSLLGSNTRAPAALEERTALKQMVPRSNPSSLWGLS